MPTWPASLPQSPEREGYSEQPGFPVVQAPVDGPALSRRRYTAVPKSYACSFLLTQSELAIFESFFEADLAHGALAYDWKERGIATNPTRQFRIVEEPAYAYLGGTYWRVSLKLIRLP